MPAEWLVLHGGALGDLVLTIQLALRLPQGGADGALDVLSRVDCGDLSACRPSIRRRSSEGAGLHWLFADGDEPPPPMLASASRGRRILSALGGTHTLVHHRLQELSPAAVYSIDPRAREGVGRHIAEQWRTQLEAQGLLVPKCVHQRPGRRGLGVPEALRERGRSLLGSAGAARDSVLLHPGSGGRAKCWPLACFVEAGRQLGATGRAACILAGPVELETWPEDAWPALREEFVVLRCAHADDLVALLAAARAFVGNDAGPSHLAALLGTATVTVFGPSDARVWQPIGPRVRVLIGDPDARPENWGVEPSAVLAALGELL